MELNGTCYCPTCHHELDGRLVVDKYVWLERHCPDHGHARTMLFSDPGFFAEAVEVAAADWHVERHICLVSEVTERCDVGCATCSASSTNVGNELEAHKLVASIIDQAKTIGADVVALSGGEPLMRKDLWDIIDILHLNFPKIVLITSGRGFETDPAILSAIAERAQWLEIYLQFDSLDDKVLKTLRIPTMTANLRRQRLNLAIETGAATTAVCIVPPDSTEEMVGDLALYCQAAGAAGITFQPLRRLGRHSPPGLSYGPMSTIDYIQACALKAMGVVHATPHPFVQQPFDMTVAFVRDNDVQTSDKFFLDNLQKNLFRVATSSYWDSTNYYSKFPSSGRFYFYVSGGRPLNTRYFSSVSTPREPIVRNPIIGREQVLAAYC